MPRATPMPRSHPASVADDLAPRSRPHRAVALAGLLFAACLLLTAFLAQPAALAWTDGPGDVQAPANSGASDQSSDEQEATPEPEPAPAPDPETVTGQSAAERTAIAELATPEPAAPVPAATPGAPQPGGPDEHASGTPAAPMSVMVAPTPPVEPRDPEADGESDDDVLPDTTPEPDPEGPVADEPPTSNWLSSSLEWLSGLVEADPTVAGWDGGTEGLPTAAPVVWSPWGPGPESAAPGAAEADPSQAGLDFMNGLLDWGKASLGLGLGPEPQSSGAATPIGRMLGPNGPKRMPTPDLVGALPSTSPMPSLALPGPTPDQIGDLPSAGLPPKAQDDQAQLPAPSAQPAPSPTIDPIPTLTPTPVPPAAVHGERDYGDLAPKHSVVPLFVVPTDWTLDDPEIQRDAQAIRTAMETVRVMYGNDLGGRTFHLAELKVIPALHDREFYGVEWDGDDVYDSFGPSGDQEVIADVTTFSTLVRGEMYLRGYPTRPSGPENDYVVVIFFKGAGDEARGNWSETTDGGYGILGDYAIDGIQGRVPESAYGAMSLRIDPADCEQWAHGLVAHELGHGFGLEDFHGSGAPAEARVMGVGWKQYPSSGFADTADDLLRTRAAYFRETVPPLTDW